MIDKGIKGQLNLFNEWPLCFQVCKNFKLGIPFPGTNDPRCGYGIEKDGTTGHDLEHWIDNKKIFHMRCIYFKE